MRRLTFLSTFLSPINSVCSSLSYGTRTCSGRSIWVNMHCHWMNGSEEMFLPLMIWIIRCVATCSSLHRNRRNTNRSFFPTQPFSVNLISSRATTNATGTMHIKVGFVHPPNLTIRPDFVETYNALIKRSRPSLVSAPPVRIVSATIRAPCNARPCIRPEV